MSFSIIDEYVSLISQYTDAHEILLESNALLNVSAIVGRRFVIPYNPKIRIFGNSGPSGLYLNIFQFIIGPSRISRKSTSQGFQKDLINSIDPNLLITESFTPEALLDELKERGDYNQSAWLVDEAARFFEVCKKKEYMASAQSIIQQLYDGHTITHRTKSGGKITIVEPYFVAAMQGTPFLFEEKLIKLSDFHHGFLNRFLLIWVPKRKEYKPIPFSEEIKDSERIGRIIEWFRKLYEIQQVKILGLSSEVIKKFANFDKKIDEIITKTEDPTFQSYIGNFPEFLVKLMGLYRIARLDFNKPLPEIIVIEGEDYKRALKYLSLVEKSFKEICNKIQEHQRVIPLKIEDISDLENVVKRYIAELGEVDRTTLLRSLYNKYKIRSKVLDEIVKELESRDEITITVKQSESAGRPRIIYSIKKFRK